MNSHKPHVVIPLKTNARHLQQVFTGMEALEKKGQITLCYDDKVSRHHRGGMQVYINEKEVYIDCSDSSDIHREPYANCDVYFKRMLKEDDFTALEKIEPFGLYFENYPSIISKHGVRRFLSFSPAGISNKVKTLIKAVDINNHLSFMPRTAMFENSVPNPQSQKILFYVRLWDPENDKEFELSEVEKADRESINAGRIQCIRSLKEKFGNNALVGVMDNDYSRRIAPDLIVSEEKTSKSAYLEQVKSASICIASAGLHGSIGAKFAEYVALGKAIVSESFNYRLPGNIAEPTHYLQFNSPEQCIEQVQSLLIDTDHLQSMGEANKQYFKDYLAPERIARRLLDTTLALSAR